MPEAVGGSFDNEQPEPKAFRASGIEAEKRLENTLELIRWDPLAGIVHLDTNSCPAAFATDKDTPSRRWVIESVASEIAQNSVKQHGLAHDYRSRRQ